MYRNRGRWWVAMKLAATVASLIAVGLSVGYRPYEPLRAPMNSMQEPVQDVSTVERTVTFANRDALLAAVYATLRPNEPTAILGGHFTLAFNSRSSSFRPLVLSDLPLWADEPGMTWRLKHVVGDFPETTFALAARLASQHPTQTAKLLMLVNDVHFRLFQRQAPTGNDLAESRRKYYRSPSPLPNAMIETLAQYSLAEDAFLLNDAVRPDEHTLPSNTFLFSELILQKEFASSRKTLLLTRPQFREVMSSVMPGSTFVARSQNASAEICLIGADGECRCSGAAMELLFRLADQGFSRLVLFIPGECRPQVQAAAAVGFGLLTEYSQITLVWGGDVDDNGVTEINTVTFLERNKKL